MCWLTLRPDPVAASGIDQTAWYCIACGPAGTADLFQNTLLLLPLGLAAGLAGWSLRRAAPALLALAVGIETLQAVIGNGRDAALGDVIANGAGGLLGWCLVLLGGRQRPRLLRAVAPSVVGLFIAQLIATASLNGAMLAGPEPWQLRLRPEVADRPTYRREIFSIALGGRSIIMESPNPRQPRDPRASALHVRFAWDPAAGAGLSAIARLDDARHWAIATIDRRDGQVGIAVRTRGGWLRLHTPTWLITVPAGATTGDTLDLSLTLLRGSAVVAMIHDGHTITQHFRYGAQHGWALINPFTRAHGSASTWNNWTLGWLLGWGMLIGIATTTRLRAPAWLAAALVGLLVVTAVAGATATPLEMLSLSIGWCLPVLMGRRFRWPATAA